MRALRQEDEMVFREVMAIQNKTTRMDIMAIIQQEPKIVKALRPPRSPTHPPHKTHMSEHSPMTWK